MSKPHYPTRTDSRITSRFGLRTHPITKKQTFHFGIDLAPKQAGTRGVPIYAVRDGIVTGRFFHSGSGNTLQIKHNDENISTSYSHLDLVANKGMLVNKGEKVKQGQRIGTMGTTGNSTGIHLHFEVIKGNQFNHVRSNYLDPISYLNKSTGNKKVSSQSDGYSYFADEVIKGTYGIGHDRREAYIYNLVRDRVNGKGTPKPYDDIVNQVKRGEFGIGHNNRSSAIYKKVRELVNKKL